MFSVLASRAPQPPLHWWSAAGINADTIDEQRLRMRVMLYVEWYVIIYNIHKYAVHECV